MTMHFNATHVIVAFVLLAGLDCILSYMASKGNGLREANPVMAWAESKIGLLPALLLLHYVPLGVAIWMVHHGNLDGWGLIIDGIAIFGAVDIWDAYQLHKAGKL
jgi:hypothetical protein